MMNGSYGSSSYQIHPHPYSHTVPYYNGISYMNAPPMASGLTLAPPLTGRVSNGASPGTMWMGGMPGTPAAAATLGPRGWHHDGALPPFVYYRHFHALVKHNLWTARRTIEGLESMGFAPDSSLSFEEQCNVALMHVVAQSGRDGELPSEIVEGSFRYGAVDVDDVALAQRLRVITLKNPTAVPMTVRHYSATAAR
jgi:hypothetical protein